MTQSSFMNRLGHWNPQFLRECRGRLKARTVSATIALTALAQILLLLSVWQLSSASASEKWLTIWSTITGTLPFLLFALGSYYLVNDLTQEQKQGTLNFIRLSPRPAWQILLGKLLGVPLLCYLALALTIPIHLVSAVGAGISVLLVLSFYVMLVAAGGFCYSIAMLSALLGSTQPGFNARQNTLAISYAAIVLLFIAPLFSAWNAAITWYPFYRTSDFRDATDIISWLYIPINQNLWLSHGFTLINLGIGTFFIWRLLVRRFRQPRTTVLSKRQSYSILFYVEVLILGFALPLANSSSSERMAIGIFVYGFTVGLLLLLMIGICPQRQALSDWVRYRPRGWQSFLWADKSPALVAMLILLLIANALLLPWSLLLPTVTQTPVSTLMAFAIVTTILFIYGVFVQQVYATKIRNPTTWAMGAVLVWWAVPPALLGLLGLVPTEVPAMAILWSFLGYPFVGSEQIIFSGIGILAQWLLLAFLLHQFQKTLRHLQHGE